MNLKKRAFSMVDAIIITVAVAAVIAVSTPLMTRKVVNIAGPGPMDYSAGHGRYEVFNKEIITDIDGGPYEKSVDPNVDANADSILDANQIRVYVRQSDLEYKNINKKVPELDVSTGRKETLYKEYNAVNVRRDSKGEITHVEIENEYVPAGGRYVVENQGLTYYGYDEANKQRKQNKLSSNKRIIEGNLTTQNSPKTHNGHNLWYLGVSNNSYKAKVKVVPWERMYSGSHKVFDRAVENQDGKYTATFNPTEKIKNVVVHAVGAGGAGGGIDKNKDLNGSITPKTATETELQQMAAQLSERIEKRFGVKDAVVIDKKGDSIKNNSANPLYKNKNKWVALDTTDGTIVGKIDTTNIRKMILPHHVLDYTEFLGNQIQDSVVRDMPKLLTSFDVGTKYKAGSGVIGTNGGKAGDININLTTDVDTDCMRKHNTTVPSGYTRGSYHDALIAAKCTSELDYCRENRTFPSCSCTPAACPVTTDDGEGASAAKINYSIGEENIYKENIIDKIKNLIFRDEIDLTHPIAHASGCTCTCKFYDNTPATKTCTGKNECGKTCSKTVDREYYSCSRRTVCTQVHCKGITPNQYYKCDSYTAHYKGSTSCGSSYDTSNKTVSSCNDRSCERVGVWPNTIKGGSGGKAHAAYACVSANKGLVIIDEPHGFDGAKVLNPGQNCNPDPVVYNKMAMTFTCAANSLTNGSNGTTRMIQVSNPSEYAIATSGGGYGGKVYVTDRVKFSTEVEYDEETAAEIEKVKQEYAQNSQEWDRNAEPGQTGLEQALACLLPSKVASAYHAMQQASLDVIKNSTGDDVHKTDLAIYDAQTETFTTNENNIETIKAGVNKNLECKKDGDRLVCSYPNMSGMSLVVDFSAMASKEFSTSTSFVCDLIAGSMRGTNGRDGLSTSKCSEADRKGIGTDGKPYNHIYVWKIPYRVNKLAYGEAGQAGEYKTAKINKVTEPLNIKLGVGGVWTNDNWKNNVAGANGTDTVVKMGDKSTVVVARGGKGGFPSSETDKYDLCLAKIGECKVDGDDDEETGIECCNKERGKRSTKDIVATAIKYSLFENIRALVGNSDIIGIGAGRGGEGAGTRAGFEENFGTMKIYNISAYDGYNNNKPLWVGNDHATDPSTAPSGTSYKNTVQKPSELTFKGGDGAVIITW